MIKKINRIGTNTLFPSMLIAGLLFAGCISETIPARTGSWGDQGDGTYKNPILNADYPDVDVEQVGDTYYLISSKQHMSPGMVILDYYSSFELGKISKNVYIDLGQVLDMGEV